MTPITDDFQGHLGLAGFITLVIEFMKRSNLPFLRWIGNDSKKAAVVIASAWAVVTTWGFQLQWEGTWPGFMELWDQGGRLTIDVPALVTIFPNLDTLVRSVGQVMLQLGTYHGIVKNVLPSIATPQEKP